MTFPYTHHIRWNGDGTANPQTLNLPQAINSGSFTATDNNDDNWTVGEEVISIPFFNSGGSAASDDAFYMGTTTINGTKYPVFHDTSTFYFVLFNGPNAATDAAALQAAGLAPVTAESYDACFAAGTMISTTKGEVAVQDLMAGDMIVTADGRAVPVKWLGYQDLFPSNVTQHMQPVRIRTGALGDNVPNADLVVTANHAMMLDGLLVNAGALINGDTIDYLPLEECDFRLRVYHVETEAHEAILANGAASESYLDVPNRASFDNYDDYLDTHGPDRLIHEMPLPRISSKRLLPATLKERLGTVDAEPMDQRLSA